LLKFMMIINVNFIFKDLLFVNKFYTTTLSSFYIILFRLWTGSIPIVQ